MCSHVPKTRFLVATAGQNASSVRADGYGDDLFLMMKWLTEELPGARVPQADRGVGSTGGEKMAIGTEGHRIDLARMPDGCIHSIFRRGVFQPGCAAVAAGLNHSACAIESKNGGKDDRWSVDPSALFMRKRRGLRKRRIHGLAGRRIPAWAVLELVTVRTFVPSVFQ